MIAPLVPPEVLLPLAPHERRGLDRGEAALVLDGYLRRLARREALCRRVAGRLAALFIRRNGHHRLTFARLDDYAKERLGISARELQSFATVASKLTTLPLIGAAFDRGDLSWSHVRLLAAVATPESEARWLAIAVSRPVRALEREIRSTGSAVVAEAARIAAEDVGAEEIDGESRATIRVRCPRWVLGLFRDVVELARKVAGEHLSLWRATEAIAAEGITAAEPDSVPPIEPRDREWVERAKEVTVRRLIAEVDWTRDRMEAKGLVIPPSPPAAKQKLDRPERQMCARVDGAFVDCEVVVTAPESVVALFRAAIRAHAHPWEPCWRGLARLLETVKAEWEALPRHRDPIFDREDWRCGVPACSSRGNFEDHHIVFRSHGGSNELTNRICLCFWHHKRALHMGLLRASGRAPDTMIWELGIRPGKEPLMRFFGDSYVDRESGEAPRPDAALN